MGKPAVSFFPNTPLSVDQELIDAGRIFHSRNPRAIVQYVEDSSRTTRTGNLERSQNVREEVIDIVDALIRDLTQADMNGGSKR